MRVCIVGCGAVGSLFAANLAGLDDVEVWAFDLNEAHVHAINEKGLQLKGAGEAHGYLRATTDPGELPPCDFGIVATKAMHAGAAIAATAHAFRDGAVASVMNGIGNEEAIAAHVVRVIRGTTFPAGKILEPGVVQWDVKGDTSLGPFEPQPAGRQASGRQRNMPQPSIVSTLSRCWLSTSHCERTRPTPGRLAISLASSTVNRTLSVSPG